MITENVQVPPAAPEIPTLSDLVVLKKADLQRLLDAVGGLWDSASEEGCEAPYFVGDMTYMQGAREAAGVLLQSKPLDQALRRVDGDLDNGSDPILVVLPTGVDDQAAADLMDAAIEQANQETNFGKDGGYFEALQERLSTSGIAITGGIEELRCQPWDADAFAGPDLDESDGDWLDLEFESDPDEPYQINPVGRLNQGGEPVLMEPVPDATFIGFCTELHVTYPNGSKYGVPSSASERGGADFVRQITQMGIHKDFEVYATDSGDDGVGSFTMRAMVHKDCMQPVERPADRSREGGQ